jgi:hypothetical protein
LGQRNRKRGQRDRPTNEDYLKRYQARADERNAEARAKLEPLKPGEHPAVLWVAIAITAVCGGGQLILYAIGVKIDGKPVPPSSLLLCVVLVACAVGMWRLWFQAVLGFLALLGFIICGFALLLVEASNVLAVVIGLFVVVGGGYLFWKLVRVLSRLQMPERPQPR